MTQPEQIKSMLERILPTVRKPGRYTGGELNQVVKNWDQTPIRTALFFPEIYDLGMSNLALMVLYDLLNQKEDVLAERTFVPCTDMEDAMRSSGLPLYSLESKRAVKDFDILGVFLPYESIYTNVLNGLDLAEIPLKAEQRTRDHPLIIGGGHAVFNPEPVAPFFDAFVIGEGEEAYLDVLEVYQSWPREKVKSKADLLKKLASLEGIYVPSLYIPRYHADGTISKLEKSSPEAPDTITKRIIPKLPPPPTKLIVPYIDIVHDRAPLEIMRGCTRGCRFCHAGMINRPVRERSIDEIIAAIESIIPQTGYSEIGLLSLSSSDYTQIVELVKQVREKFAEKEIAISLPSLRIETVSVELMDQLADKRRSGFTLAPEAASPRMRKVINKEISDQALLDTAREIYSRGWHTIKLYFMIGLPGETLEDVKAIANLAKNVRDVGEKQIGRRAQVHVSAGTFVPKPQTPFQWVPCAKEVEIKEKLDLLQQEVRGWGLKLNWNDPQETLFEAWLSRGDRRLAEVIFRAWQLGAKFDNWGEHFDYQRWMKAFQEAKLDPAFYAHRTRGPDEKFPWEHISSAVKKSVLLEDYLMSQEGKTRPDCREGCYACGILPTFSELRREHPGDHWLCPEIVHQ